MPMLADIEDPPRSRAGGMLVGILVALPIAGLVVVFLLPALVDAVLGGSRKLDERVSLETAYMNAVCTQAIELPRDESLCECVLATEYAGLDCQAPFIEWSVARQQEYCASPENEKASLSFCTCVGEIAKMMSEAADEEEAQRVAQNYRNCQDIPDAVNLPTPEELGAETPVSP